MMGYAEIQELVNEASCKAEAESLEPVYVTKGMLDDMRAGTRLYPIPFLGDYIPNGWEQTEERYFCDTSGFGQPDEPALTQDQFLKAMEPGFGYAIIEAGQFQCHVAQYRHAERYNVAS